MAGRIFEHGICAIVFACCRVNVSISYPSDQEDRARVPIVCATVAHRS